MLLSYFDYIFAYLRQKARLRLEPDPKSPARLTTLFEIEPQYSRTFPKYCFQNWLILRIFLQRKLPNNRTGWHRIENGQNELF